MDSEDGEIFFQDDFMSQSFDEFEDMRRNEQLVDFKINFKGRSLVGHRLVLAARIPYFRQIFCRPQEEVTLNEVDPDALESVINFAYSGKIKITRGNVESLLSVSKVLQLTRVYEACWEFLEKKLNPNNLLESRKLAEHYNFSKILEATDKYIKENFEEFTSSESFLTLPFLQLKEIISGDDVKVSMEEKVFEAVIRWVKAVPSERKDFLPELLSSVRLCFLTPDYLIECVSTEEFVRSSLRCKELVDEAKNYHLLPHKRSKFCSLISWPRFHNAKSLSPHLPSQPSNSVHRISPDGEPRTLLYSVYRSSVSRINVKLFDRKNEKWLNSSSFDSPERMDAVVLLDRIIYIFTESSIHMFNINTSKWNSSLHAGEVLGSGSASYNGKIYFFGGLRDKNAVQVRSFDPEQQKLSRESCMPKSLEYPGVTLLSSSESAHLKRFIFITGGSFKGNIYNTVQLYNPDTKQLSEASTMHSKRWGHSCCDLKGKIYAVGGFTGDSTSLTSAEVYDPVTDQWSLFSLMRYPGNVFPSLISDEDENSLVFATPYYTEIYDLKTKKLTTRVKMSDAYQYSKLHLVKSM